MYFIKNYAIRLESRGFQGIEGQLGGLFMKRNIVLLLSLFLFLSTLAFALEKVNIKKVHEARSRLAAVLAVYVVTDMPENETFEGPEIPQFIIEIVEDAIDRKDLNPSEARAFLVNIADGSSEYKVSELISGGQGDFTKKNGNLKNFEQALEITCLMHAFSNYTTGASNGLWGVAFAKYDELQKLQAKLSASSPAYKHLEDLEKRLQDVAKGDVPEHIRKAYMTSVKRNSSVSNALLSFAVQNPKLVAGDKNLRSYFVKYVASVLERTISNFDSADITDRLVANYATSTMGTLRENLELTELEYYDLLFKGAVPMEFLTTTSRERLKECFFFDFDMYMREVWFRMFETIMGLEEISAFAWKMFFHRLYRQSDDYYRGSPPESYRVVDRIYSDMYERAILNYAERGSLDEMKDGFRDAVTEDVRNERMQTRDFPIRFYEELENRFRRAGVKLGSVQKMTVDLSSGGSVARMVSPSGIDYVSASEILFVVNQGRADTKKARELLESMLTQEDQELLHTLRRSGKAESLDIYRLLMIEIRDEFNRRLQEVDLQKKEVDKPKQSFVMTAYAVIQEKVSRLKKGREDKKLKNGNSGSPRNPTSCAKTFKE